LACLLLVLQETDQRASESRLTGCNDNISITTAKYRYYSAHSSKHGL
jgi:hypothetical protein